MKKYTFLLSIIIIAPLSAMNDDAKDWLKKAQEAFEATAGTQKVEEQSNEDQKEQEADQVQEDTVHMHDESGVDENDPATWFQECPAQGEPLTCDYFKKRRYWKQAVSLPAKKKNEMLHHLGNSYSTERCKIGGWVCAGADPNIKMSKPSSWKHIIGKVVNEDDLQIARILIQHKVDLNKTNFWGKNPLFYAEKKEMAELLINSGADLNCKCPLCSNGTLLHHAILVGNSIDLIDLYLKHNIPVNTTDDDGDTVLHVVTNRFKAHWFLMYTTQDLDRIAQLLFKAGIDLDSKNKKGETAQDLLKECISNNENCRSLYNAIEEERKKRAKVNSRK